MTPTSGLNDPAIQALLTEGRSLEGKSLSRRELAVETVWVAALLAIAGIFIALSSPELPSLGLALTLVGAYAVLSRIEFEVSAATALPVELVFVPMLLLIDPAWVPPLVMVSLLLGGLPDYVLGRVSPGRALIRVGNASHAIAPAVVLALLADPTPSLDQWPVYLLALTAQLVVDVVATCLRDWLELGISPRGQLPLFFTVILVDATLAPLGLALALASTVQPYTFLLGLPLVALLAFFGSQRRASVDQALEMSAAYRGTAMLLGDVIEADDEYTGEHSRSVVSLVRDVCEVMGLDAREALRAEFAALLHDVGKISIPKSILLKPGALTDEEWAVMKTHTVEGERMLHRIGGLLGEVGTIVRSSHERWDGGGYPDGLVREQIPLAARIVCACDAYNAMTTNRPYREARTVHAAMAEMCACAGTQFDPDVVAALIAIVETGSVPAEAPGAFRVAA